MRKMSLKKRGLLSVLFLTIILFTQCKKDSDVFPEIDGADAVTSTTSSATGQGTLNVATAQPESGYAYYMVPGFTVAGDSNDAPTASTVRIYENGVELNPAHASHKDIRAYGKGRYSHWGNELYFSTSDNSDPRTNGRTYTYTIGDVALTSPTNTTDQSVLNVTSASSESGYAYVVMPNFGVAGDSNTSPTNSKVRIFENGVEIGPAHSSHKDIRAYGKGRFSHWGNELYFSSSDNSDPRTNGRKYTYTIGDVATTTPTTTAQSVLNVSSASLERGYSYFMMPNFGVAGDSNSSPTNSTVRIFENGVEIGPAHSSHKDIRAYGKGRFSHWGNELYFSSSDNSDPRTNGRKYTYTIGTASSETPTTTSPTSPTSPSSTVPIGYAMVNGSTTGGQGGQTVMVTNLTDFRNAAKSSSPLIIQVSGTFTGTGMVDVTSNKTIIGVNGATLNGIGLAMYGVSNIIIKNLRINKVIGADGITIKQATHHIWVDHCELWQDRDHGWDYYDELLEITDRSDYVTISNTKFHDSHIALLIGSGDQQTTDIGHLKVTMYGNYFYNISERQPCTRFGYMHVFNNYMLNGSGYAIGVTMDATVRTDNNFFENQNIPIYTDFNAKPGVVSGASTNIYKNSGSNKISTGASNWLPPYEYASVLIPAADVPARVLSEAGPKY